jgi:tRNA-dihydrouridine synthase
MVGRGALGRPWIFQQIEAYLSHEVNLPEPPMAQRMSTLMRQVQLTTAYKGERVALLEARKHTAWYLNGMRGAAQLRREAGTLTSMEDLVRLCARVIQMDEEGLL